MNILWISGKSGCGKTAFADSKIKEFEEKDDAEKVQEIVEEWDIDEDEAVELLDDL